MKKLITLTVCFILAGSLVAKEGNDTVGKKPKAATAPDVQLVLELTDGSRIIGAPTINRLTITARYAKLEFLLSRSRMIEFSGANHTAQVSLQNGDVLNGQLVVTEITVKTASGRVVTPLAKMNKIRILVGPIIVNSLGMEFVTVPGTRVLFSIWDTRVQDYRAYAEANPGVNATWKNPGFKQGENHPVIAVTWDEAKAFCAWLTQKERKEGKIGQDQEYRLPTDKEWSAAVGEHKYPWGNDWPPPKGAGNYDPSLNVDNFDHTSPVGSFKANEYGLYDMGGNVWQWCEDWYRGDMNEQALLDKYPLFKDDGGGEKYRVLRGASWNKRYPVTLWSSYRFSSTPGLRFDHLGFRCVLAPVQTSD